MVRELYQIVYEDEHLIAVSKAAGISVIPGRGLDHEPLRLQLEHNLRKKLLVVHRIDRETSGLVLFGKDSATHKKLCRQFERRQVSKVYHAVVQGMVEKDGKIDAPIRVFGSGRMGIDFKKGKESLTRYRVIERWLNSTLLEVRPETGRRHQIRVHLFSIGHPVLGDTLYGQPRPVAGSARLMLHAIQLTITYPGKDPLTLRADPTPDFLSELDKYR